MWNRTMLRNSKVFKKIYQNNDFKGKESVSGPGSDLSQTSTIRIEIPTLLKEMKVKTILDAPCGDFYWMKELNFERFRYIGIDIVKDMIKMNKKSYENEYISFRHLDLLNDKLPEEADLILC